MHRLFEHSTAMFVALELIEAGAGRSKKDNVARRSRFAGASDSVFERFRMIDFSSTPNLRLDLGRRGSDGVHALHALPQQLIEHAVVAALIPAAENEVNIRRERFQRLDRRIHIRGLGVIVVINASDPPHELQPVLDGFESPNSMPDLFGLTTDEAPDGNTREHIFQVVRTFELHFRQGHDLALVAAVTEVNMSAADKGSSFNLLLSAEP